MNLKWEITLWILARCIFIGLPETPIDWFPFSDDSMPMSSYGWAFIEMAFMCRLAYKWAHAENKHFRIVVVLFWTLVFDLAHFILTGNSFYSMIGKYPMTNNVLMLLFWGIFAMTSGKHGIANNNDKR